MIELFRYIEQAFALPDPTGSIDTQSDTDLQNSLRNAVSKNQTPDQIRSLADKFLGDTFPQEGDNPITFASSLLSFAKQLQAMKSPSEGDVADLVYSVFEMDAGTLVSSEDFLHDKDLLNDALVSVKLVTAFDRPGVADFATMRQAIAFLEDFAAGSVADFSPDSLKTDFQRPIRIPKTFVDALKAAPPRSPSPSPTPPSSARSETGALVAEQQALQSAYEAIMSLQPQQFALKTLPVHATPIVAASHLPEPAAHISPREASSLPVSATGTPSAPLAPTVPSTVIERLGTEVNKTLERASIDVVNTPVSSVVAAIRKQWQKVTKELVPYQIPASAPVFRVGMNLFAIQPTVRMDVEDPVSKLFRKAITRPVGIGDLQVVRQELIGYEAGEISHIENVLEGELLRRSTRREEINELTVTQETDTTQVEERDQQSTSRNELSSEAQKESGQQSTSVKDQTTTTDYGKLVENSKTNYARSVTDRAVNTLTQMVKVQRVQREKKTFTEKAMHELDNRKGDKKVRGIYQWVDKKFKARILNYGKRLLYDVVIPEPAAFFLDSLKKAAQPENFQLTKPTDPNISPGNLNAGNYSYYAAQYGVTGSVTPPPDEFLETFAHPDNKKLGSGVGAYFSAYIIPIPKDYTAFSGYIQFINPLFAQETPVFNEFEFFIGESHWFRFGNAPNSTAGGLNISFLMKGESGEVPVTFRTLPPVVEFSYAIGINCKRTEKAYEQWQLKTHAVIMSGYQRQLVDYQDKLAQYQSVIKSQMALAQNFAHDPSIEQEELKKAFIFLLLGEHFGQAFHPTPNPGAIPPDPTAVRDWGAMVAFFERAFEWENLMYTYYPYFWGRQSRWGELILIQDIDPQFEAFLKAGAARIVIPTRPGFEAALAHYQETGDIWMGEEIPDMFSDFYVSIIEEIKARNFAPSKEVCVAEWDVKLPTTLVMLKDDETLPEWTPTMNCNPPPEE